MNKMVGVRKFLGTLPEEVRRSDVKRAIDDYTDDIIPFELYRGTRKNIVCIADQINKSFFYGIFDGAAVLMRRLVEMLLILAFHKVKEEEKIKGGDGNYFQLAQIIREAEQNRSLDLSRNAKNYLGILKEKGDLSAHNPFHICVKRDLELLQQKYRHVIQELLYKAGVSA